MTFCGYVRFATDSDIESYSICLKPLPTLRKEPALPKTPYAAPFVIAVDTREQNPFPLVGLASMRKTLKAGDYSIVGLEDRVAVERKSYTDAWGSMSEGRARFERCVKRLAELDRAAIVIECTVVQLAQQPSYIQRVTGASVVGGLISWSAQYRLPVFFCDDRLHAERVTLRFLASYFKHRGGNGTID